MAELLDFQRINTKSELLNFLNEHREENAIYDSVMEKYLYEEELKKLQAELVNLQNWIQKKGKKSPLFLKEETLREKAVPSKDFPST